MNEIPFKALQRPVAEATAVLVRLDERLSGSALGAGCLERLSFLDACASLWIDGELVHLEDLVLHDALRDVRSPTHELTVAHSVLRTRRKIIVHAPDWATSPQGLSNLKGVDAVETGEGKDPEEAPAPTLQQDGKDGFHDPLADDLAAVDKALASSNAVLSDVQSARKTPRKHRAPLVYDPDWDEDRRLSAWRDVERQSLDLPPVLRAAVLLDAWNRIAVFERMPWLGRLLAAASFRAAGLTGQEHLMALNLGLKAIDRQRRTSRHQQTRLEALLEAIATAADLGLKEHSKLVLARRTFDHRLTGRRRSSRLPEVVNLVLARPMVSASMIAKTVGVTPQAALRLIEELNLRELTGRGRFRVWGIV